MILQIEVTKVSVTEQMDKLWNITLNLTCWPEGIVKEYPVIEADGSLDMRNAVIYKNFSVRYRPGQDIAEKEAELSEMMQEEINRYKSEQQILTHSQLDAVVSGLNADLTG